MLSDILPTGYECGVLNGKVAPGSSVAIVGAGPIGLATLLTAQFYAPARIIMIDLDDNRLAVARKFGATDTFNSGRDPVVSLVRELTDGKGVDTAIEAVGIPATFPPVTSTLPPGSSRNAFLVYQSLQPGTSPTSAEGEMIQMHCLDVSRPIATAIEADEALFKTAIGHE